MVRKRVKTEIDIPPSPTSGDTGEISRLERELFLLETLMDNIPDSIYFKDRESRITRINHYGARHFGLDDPAQALGKTDFDFFTDEHAMQAYRDEQRIIANGEPLVNVEEKETTPDGMVRWVSTTKLPLRDASGAIVGTFGISRDITARKRAEEGLERKAFFDTLTELPNRALFMNRLQHLFHRARRARHVHERLLFAVLYLDLDRFKGVNDSLGHEAGDELLVGIARRLEQHMRPSDTLARLGGDEFTVLLEDIGSEADAIRVTDRIQHGLAAPMHIQGQDVFMSASIGIALSSAGYARPEDIVRDADTAMYRAKANGRARHQVFDADMHQRAVSLLRIETDLRRAIERRELFPFYQPIVDLRTGGLVGFEALARWQHPTRGLLTPDVFIPVAEEAGLIGGIGDLMLAEACRQMRQWHLRHPRNPPLTISVNVSTRQLVGAALVDKLRQVLSDTGLDPTSLVLEITESALMHNIQAGAAVIQQLRDMAVRLHVDDFGTGYSSLSYLHSFPVDTLKVDKSFVSRMLAATRHASIVNAIVSLARNLGMAVVAEGVETQAQAALLRALRCESAQGYLFSRPLPAAEAERLIVEGIHPTDR
jgi:diguanylate cyclase (GGDEF)-like protein/PAS domain S-box-containing protein